MRKTMTIILALAAMATAYQQRWTLVRCDYTQVGYQYRHVGLYELNGDYIRLSFDSYCPYTYYW